MEENVEKLLELRSKTEQEISKKQKDLEDNLKYIEDDFKSYQTDDLLDRDAQARRFESIKKEYEDKTNAEIEQLKVELEGQNRSIGQELRSLRDSLMVESYKMKKANEEKAKLVAQAKNELDEAKANYNASLMSIFHQGELHREVENASFDQSKVEEAEEKYNKLLAELNADESKVNEVNEKVERLNQYFGKLSVKEATNEEILSAISGIAIEKEEKAAEQVEEPAQEPENTVEVAEQDKEQETAEVEEKTSAKVENPVQVPEIPASIEIEVPEEQKVEDAAKVAEPESETQTVKNNDIAPEMPIERPKKDHDIEITGEINIPHQTEGSREIYDNPYAEKEIKADGREEFGRLSLSKVKLDVRTGNVEVTLKNIKTDPDSKEDFEVTEIVSVSLGDIEEKEIKDKKLRELLSKRYGEMKNYEDPYLLHGINNAVDEYLENYKMNNEKLADEIKERLEIQYRDALEYNDGSAECQVEYVKSEKTEYDNVVSRFGRKTLEKLVMPYMRYAKNDQLMNVKVGRNIDTRTNFEKIKDFFAKVLPSKVKALGPGKHAAERNNEDAIFDVEEQEQEPQKLNPIQEERKMVQESMAEKVQKSAQEQTESIVHSLEEKGILNENELNTPS